MDGSLSLTREGGGEVTYRQVAGSIVQEGLQLPECLVLAVVVWWVQPSFHSYHSSLQNVRRRIKLL